MTLRHNVNFGLLSLTFLISTVPAVYGQTDYCQPNTSSSDSTATYCTKPNFPTYGTPTNPLPADQSALPDDNLQLESSGTNVISLVMGGAQPSANITTGQDVRNMFFMNYITGDLTKTLGSPMDTGQSNNNTFAAVARHYEVGDPNDLHLVASDGLHLRAICSQNHTNCSPGNVYAAMIRVPVELRPGMTIEVRYKSPAGWYSWAPIWMFSGSEFSPGPGGNPYQGFGTNTSLVQLPVAHKDFEIDLNDNFARWWDTYSGSSYSPTGYQVDFGTPNGYGVKWQTPPHQNYWADGYGYKYLNPDTGNGYEQLPFNWSAGFHDLVLSWQTDNQLYEFVDGKLIVEAYMEYPAPTYQDGFDGNVTKVQAMNLMIGNQAIPSFAPSSSSLPYAPPSGTKGKENDGIPDGWTIVVQKVAVWKGNIVNPWSYEAAPNGCQKPYCE